MRKIPVEFIKDGDILAKDLFTSSGVVLMSEGTKLKKEYIARLLELEIDQVYLKDTGENSREQSGNVIEEEVKEQCGALVRSTIQKYAYASNDELQEIVKVADDMITDILSDPQIMYNVSCVREKSNALYLHSINVAAISTLIALRAKFPKKKVRDITIGALLHDIGFTTVTVDTTNLSLETCDEKTRKEVMHHVVFGYTDVETKDWVSKTVKDIILHHHERLDGSGYPFHQKAGHIKPEVRIVSLCDQFDSMIYGNLTKRYKVRDAMEYIMSQAGVQFDFKFVQLFMESVAAYPIGITVVTNEGDTAVVVRQNYKFPTRPVIRLLKNKDGVDYGENEERDLTKYLTLFIADSIEY
ncbi:MAG: HD domain-containing protein [Lachnospiraceae bacterium]|nr:HD domain-containing protein [Lachnospiraceae bacterium]